MIRMRPSKKQKILIIKIGYSETLDPGISTQCSLGDVLRTTAILHLFKKDRVTWLTDQAAIPLLQGNPFIERILSFDLMSALLLMAEEFDVVVNLEKVPAICALSEKIKAWRRYGFRLDSQTGRAEAYEHAYDALYISSHIEFKKRQCKSWLINLFEMLGEKYHGENYLLGYKPTSTEKIDLGFNIHVSSKWPNKAWPISHWKKLENLVSPFYSYEWQKGTENLFKYIDWVSSCRLLITNDSLGLHIALALRKKIVAIFGPTIHHEIHEVSGLRKLVPDINKYPCAPCVETLCASKKKNPCISDIKPKEVLTSIQELLGTTNQVDRLKPEA